MNDRLSPMESTTIEEWEEFLNSPQNRLNAEMHNFKWEPKEKRMSPIMKFFEFEHLPPKLKAVSEPICSLAKFFDENLPDGAEKSAGLRKLLEAKDCLVRAAL